MKNETNLFYGNRLRVRACGICTNETGILLINHRGVSESGFWSPPGGGIEFGETAEQCVKREFIEETDLTVAVGDFLFACELIKQPLHAIELFFEVFRIDGKITLGADPELPLGKQLLTELKFIAWSEINSMNPASLHGIFQVLNNPSAIKQLRGYFKL